MTPLICPKTIDIYHIKGKKVGSSGELSRRISAQGYTFDDCEVLHEIKPNTMTYRKIWELECSEQERFGYPVENEGNYQTFLSAHTNHSTTNPAVRAKLSAAHTGKTRSETHKSKISAATTGENHPGAKFANIYSKDTHELIAEDVIITVWARENGYNHGNLSATARADRSQPHHCHTNRYHHKGIYARYTSA